MRISMYFLALQLNISVRGLHIEGCDFQLIAQNLININVHKEFVTVQTQSAFKQI
jgi:hypothetical protein